MVISVKLRWAIVAVLSFLALPFLVAVLQAQTSTENVRIGGGAAATTDIAELEDFIDGFVAAKMVNEDPPGMSVAVVSGDQSIANGYGIADMETGRAVDGDTLFRIGSISKLFVWLSAHMLADEGKIDLDADVNSYLDGFAIPDKFGKPITMRDLMGHRAGFEDNLRDFIDSDRNIPLRDAVSRQFPERVAPPGERASYSNSGTNLAAYIVERASGMPYNDFVQTRILAPSGMDATTLSDPEIGRNPEALEARMARPHKIENGTAVLRPYMSVRPQEPVGAVAMSARDAATFMRLLLNETQIEGGERLLSEAGWQRLASSPAFPEGADGDDMGWGFMMNQVDGASTIGHGGATAFLSWMFVVPERDVGVFVSSNMISAESRGEDLAWAIVRRVAGTNAAADFRMREGDVEAAEEVAGSYLNNRRPFRGGMALTAIGGDTTISANEGFITMPTGSGQTRYAPLAADVWVALDGRRLRVVRDDDGNITRLHTGLGSSTLERVGFLDTTPAAMLGFGGSILLSLTTLLGIWFRWGRKNATTPVGRKVMWVSLVSALLWLLFALLGAITVATLADFDIATVDENPFPPLSMQLLFAAVVALVVQAVIHVIAIVPAWTKSGWAIWRRIHFTLFGIAFAFAAWLLWRTGAVGASFYG